METEWKSADTRWKSYRELAWTEPIIGSPRDAEPESRKLVSLSGKGSRRRVNSLLHLGCGAGIHDWIFKRYFRVVGIDISPEMLRVARSLNPETDYREGDMRSCRLPEKFEVVVAADSIGYMTSIPDLRRALETAAFHLSPGGVFICPTLTAENFRENNFVYRGRREDVVVTLFENNCRPVPGAASYEATFFYHVRKSGGTEVHVDRHMLGLFSYEAWCRVLSESGFAVQHRRAGRLYDRWLKGGSYDIDIFICRLGRWAVVDGERPTAGKTARQLSPGRPAPVGGEPD